MSEIGRVPPSTTPPVTTPAPAPAATPDSTATPTPAPASGGSGGSAAGANKILDSSGQAASPKPAASDSVRTSDVAQAAKSGATLEANVVARDGNAFVLRTQGGTTLVIAANPTLAAVLSQGGTLKLTVLPGTPPSASLLSANGISLQPPLAALLQNPTPTQLALAVPQAGQAQAPALPNPGQPLAATVLPPAPQASSAQGAAPLAAGQAAPLLVPADAAASSLLTPGSQAQLVVRAVAEPGASLPPAILNAANKPTLPPALTAQATLPGAAAPQGASALLAGVVTGQGPLGQTLLRTPQGMLALDLPQPLAPGSQLALELTTLVRPAGPSVTQLAPIPAAGILQRLQGGWPLLQQTLDAVRAVNPELAARLAQTLPQPNARLASNALQFMAAAAMGSAQAWLGAEAAKALKDAGKGELLKKLDDDFRDLGKLNQRGGDNDWQALTLPMMVQGRVEPVQIFMRRRRDKKKNQTQSRFILDFNLESTGPVQFDGYMADKKLDLILRSLTEFGPAFKLDVQQIFDDALASTGMTGSIRFHDREPPIPWPSPELDTDKATAHQQLRV